MRTRASILISGALLRHVYEGRSLGVVGGHNFRSQFAVNVTLSQLNPVYSYGTM